MTSSVAEGVVEVEEVEEDKEVRMRTEKEEEATIMAEQAEDWRLEAEWWIRRSALKDEVAAQKREGRVRLARVGVDSCWEDIARSPSDRYSVGCWETFNGNSPGRVLRKIMQNQHTYPAIL